jgi:hypothetical protein
LNASTHGPRAAVKTAVIVVTVLFAVSAAADGISALASPGAGVVFVVAVLVACWVIFGVWAPRHPAPARRVAPGRDPQATAPLALTESNEPAQLAA